MHLLNERDMMIMVVVMKLIYLMLTTGGGFLKGRGMFMLERIGKRSVPRYTTFLTTIGYKLIADKLNQINP